MATLNTFIPASKIDSFRTLATKVAKYVPNINVSISEPFEKIFVHIIKIDGRHNLERKWHTVHSVTVEMPDDSKWRLLVSFEDGIMWVTDPSTKLTIKKSGHGADYNKCDACGRSCNKSFLIANVETGEELQVGSSCLQKFGLSHFEWIFKLTRELRQFTDLDRVLTSDKEEESCWPDNWEDRLAYRAVETSTLLTAAKNYFSEHPKWIKGEYYGRTYIKSKSNEDIQDALWDTVADSEYAEKVCEYVLNSMKADSEFNCEMKEVAGNYYSKPADACKAFFMVKAYEDYLKEQTNAPIQAGQQIYVSGKVIHKDKYEGRYGSVVTYTIKTPTGKLVSRRGSIPVTIDGDSEYTNFYAVVKRHYRGEIEVDRALKHPKKGIEVIEI